MDKITVKQAQLSDIPTIKQIAANTWPVAYDKILTTDQIVYMLDVLYSKETLANLIKTKAQTFLLLFEKEVPVAFAAYGFKKEESQVYKLHKLYVLPVYQKKGYGQILIQKVNLIGKETGIKSLELNVNRNNLALNFYKKIGFKIIDIEDIPIGPYWMNDYIMRISMSDK